MFDNVYDSYKTVYNCCKHIGFTVDIDDVCNCFVNVYKFIDINVYEFIDINTIVCLEVYTQVIYVYNMKQQHSMAVNKLTLRLLLMMFTPVAINGYAC